MNSQKSWHPLLVRELSFIRTWTEWKKLWAAATHVETLHSLLHIGFQVELEKWNAEGIERLIMYLEIADGHCQLGAFELMHVGNAQGEDIHTPLANGWPENTLRAVAYKAFVQLCTNVFRQGPKSDTHAVAGVHYEPHWWRLASRRDSMEKLFWFLRLDEDRRERPPLYNDEGFSRYNAPRNHRDTFNAFAFEVAQLVFRWRLDSGRGSDWRAVLDEFRPAAVDILYGLGKLDLLLHPDYWKTVDERCMARIRELALKTWIHAEKYRPVESIEEAVLAGSQAAKIHLLLQVASKAQQRLDDIVEAQHQAEEAANRLRKLQQ